MDHRSCLFFNAVVACVSLVVAAGCASKPKVNEGNPSFRLTVEQAEADLDRIAKDPRPLQRPLVILGGFADPGVGGWATAAELRKYLTPAAQVMSVSFTFCHTFDACRLHVIGAVDKAFPTADPNQTAEVDVIGLSMGGLVGRYCAAPTTAPASVSATAPSSQRRLRVHTLFTAASPHRGALRAERWPQLLKMQGDMTAGSPFYRRLEEAERAGGGTSYELVPYVRLGDTVVGPQYAAPTGRNPWWIPNRPGDFAHVGTMGDPRIMSDVLRRLRGETPWTKEPPAPLPEKIEP